MDLDNIGESIEYLGNNIPNPFKNTTLIPYFVPTGSRGIMTITDINGKPVQTYTLTEEVINWKLFLQIMEVGCIFTLL